MGRVPAESARHEVKSIAMKTIIQNGTVVTAAESYQADVLIDGERIVAVGRNLPAGDARVLDAAGKYVLPGGIDVHTHLDMPLGDIASVDDFTTGQMAAAFGGTTSHIDFANQVKGDSLAETLDVWHEKARARAVIDYGFHICISDPTEAVLDEIAEMPARGVTTVKVLMAYKGRLQVDDTALFRVLGRARDAGMLTMVHAENGDAIEVLIQEAIESGNRAPKYHALTRPPQLEGEATGRAIAMAEVLDAPLYIVHLTCEDSLVRVQEARRRGSRVWAETCTQYLFCTAADLDRGGFEGAKYVCSPPFRQPKDQAVLWAALRDGDLSVVSTDHCAFNFATQKTLGKNDFSKIPNGCPGIEDRMMVLHEGGVNGDRFALERFVALTATNPARLFGLAGRKGSIAPGYDADLAIWDMDRERVITAQTSHSAVDYNLYDGMTVHGVPETVLVRGRVVVDGNRFLGEPGYGEYLPRATAAPSTGLDV